MNEPIYYYRLPKTMAIQLLQLAGSVPPNQMPGLHQEVERQFVNQEEAHRQAPRMEAEALMRKKLLDEGWTAPGAKPASDKPHQE